MTAKIYVGYRTRPVAEVEALMPKFKAPSNWKDETKILADIEEKKAYYLKSAKDAPYTGTFDCVFLLDNGPTKLMQFDYHEGKNKSPISVRVRNYLVNNYPDGWEDDNYDSRRPPFRIVGFNPRLFLKILGLECSLPSIAKPLPLRMWYSNSEHRDIEEAILPHDYEKVLDLLTVLKQRRSPSGEDREKWDLRLKGWDGPHKDPEKDVWIACELASQLGF